ncbi:MAG: hypothetical protein ACOY3D_05185 [Candidatus Omnitrophota bacterium]
MKGLDKILLVLGIIAIAYAIFSRFYGQTSIAMGHFKSSSVLLAANTILLLALILKEK